MARGLSAALITAIESESCEILTFASLAFSSGTVYVHNGIGTITWNSQDWLGVGSLGSIQKIEEGAALSPYAIQLVLTGIDPDEIDGAPAWPDFKNEILNNDYYLREVVVYMGARNQDTHALVADPDEMWRGSMENATFTVAHSSGEGISIHCESYLALMERSANLLYTDQQLQSEYAGDVFFQYLPQIPDAQPPWRVQDASGGQLVAPTPPNYSPVAPPLGSQNPYHVIQPSWGDFV